MSGPMSNDSILYSWICAHWHFHCQTFITGYKNENKEKNKTLLPNHMSGPFVEEMTLLQWHEADLGNTQCNFTLSIWKTLSWASKLREKEGKYVASLRKIHAPFLRLCIMPNYSLGIRVDPQGILLMWICLFIPQMCFLRVEHKCLGSVWEHTPTKLW